MVLLRGFLAPVFLFISPLMFLTGLVILCVRLCFGLNYARRMLLALWVAWNGEVSLRKKNQLYFTLQFAWFRRCHGITIEHVGSLLF